MAFSHHSSNPLEATPSNPLNITYHRELSRVKENYLSSDDPLGFWDTDQEKYNNHVKEIVGRNPNEVTPKARISAFATPNRRMVDLDENMSSDPLATPFQEGQTTIDPRKLKSKNEESEPLYMAEHDNEEEHMEEEGEETQYLNGQDHEEEQDFERQSFSVGDLDELDGVKQEDFEDDLDDYPEAYPDGDEDMLSLGSPLTSLSNESSPFSSPQSSRPPSPDELTTLYSRPEDEQQEIEHEITSLYKSVPELEGEYQLLDRLGTGTFSSVYKAIDLRYDELDNQPWLGHHPPESSAYYQSAGPGFRGRGGRATRSREAEPKDNRVYVAIKRIYTTSGPERIRNEISILETCRGCRHTSQIITAFRNKDQVVIVLPYQRNMDFRDFYQQLHPEGIKCYFRSLFRALRDVHARGIIHRDVKPANFLYDPFTGIGTLCDFGLASRMENGSTTGRCNHTPASEEHPHGKTHQFNEQETLYVKRMQKEARGKGLMPAEKVGYPKNDRRNASKANRAGTRGFRAPEVLLKCSAQTGAIDVWAAGVILLFFLSGKFPVFQSNDDIEALMEIAAVLGKRDLELAATLHGRTVSTNVPDLSQKGITWTDFVKKLNPDIMTPRKYDMRYYPHNSKHRDGRGSTTAATTNPTSLPPESSSPPPNSDSIHLGLFPNEPSASTSKEETAHSLHSADRHANPPSLERHTKEMRNALSFLESILYSNSTKRMTPRGALYHPFLAEPGVEGDDAFYPHPVGKGVCGELHNRDDVSEQVFVKIFRKCMCMKEEGKGGDVEGSESESGDEMKEDEGWCGQWLEDYIEAEPGEGIAIGNRPCEFHTGPPYGFD